MPKVYQLKLKGIVSDDFYLTCLCNAVTKIRMAFILIDETVGPWAVQIPVAGPGGIESIRIFVIRVVTCKKDSAV